MEVKVLVDLLPAKRSQERADFLNGEGFSTTFIAKGLAEEMKRTILLDHFNYMMSTLGLLAETNPLAAMAKFHSRRSSKLMETLMELYIVDPTTPGKWPHSYQVMVKSLQNLGDVTSADLSHPQGPIFAYLQ